MRSCIASGLRGSGCFGLTAAACWGGAGISDTDLARSCWPKAGRGGEPAALSPLKDGRMPDTLLSARDLSCSDQLKLWSARVAERMSEGDLAGNAVLA